MKGKITKVALAGLLTVIIIAVGCSQPKAIVPGAGSSAVSGAPASYVSSTPAPFALSALTVTPAQVSPGVQVMIAAKITNTGPASSSYTPQIRIDDVTGSSLPTYLSLPDSSISPGDTRQVSFLVTPDNPGTYKVAWGELAGEFKVAEAKLATADSKAPAPDFSGVDVVTGKPVSLSQFKGSVVLLNLVNYGCSPSVNDVVSKQLLAIRELTQKRSDFVPVSVFCGCCPPEVLRNFAKQNGLSWPWLLDTDNSIVRKYLPYLSKYGYPTLVFIDREQNIVGSAGYTSLSDLSTKIDQILGKTY